MKKLINLLLGVLLVGGGVAIKMINKKVGPLKFMLIPWRLQKSVIKI